MTCQGAGSPQYLKRYNQRRKYVSIKPQTVPPTQDILGDFKAFLQKLENISWVKTVANTTGNFNKFSSDISDLSEHEIYYREDTSNQFIIKKLILCFIKFFNNINYPTMFVLRETKSCVPNVCIKAVFSPPDMRPDVYRGLETVQLLSALSSRRHQSSVWSRDEDQREFQNIFNH